MTRRTSRFFAALVLGVFLQAQPSLAEAPQSLTIAMHALNGSGEDGVATLVQRDAGVEVRVVLQNGPADLQPTHIHLGSCSAINRAPEYGLAPAQKGTSVSVVRGVTLSDLLKGHYAINVHKSTVDLGTYVSCGDIHG